MTVRPAIDYEFLRKMQIQAGIVPDGGEKPAEPGPDLQQGPYNPQGQPPKWETTPKWALQQAFENPVLIGGEEARMAMFPDEYVEKKPKPKPPALSAKQQSAPDPRRVLDPRTYWFERGARGILTGITSMIPASLTMAGGLLEFAGADDAGEAVAETGLSVGEWLQEHVAVENPKFFDHVMTGFGTMSTFMLPGLGVAGLAGKSAQMLQMTGKLAKAFQAVTGAGAMSFLEAGVEQSQRQQELMSQGMTAGEAMEESEDVFWDNVKVLMLTNLAFWSPGRRVARMAFTGATEAIQERAQAVIQDVAAGRGKWSDFLDPTKHLTETGVGFVVGSTVSGFLPGKGGKTDGKPDTSAPVEAEPFEGEPPQGTEKYEPVLTGPSEVPGGPPVQQAQRREPNPARDAGEALGAQLSQDEGARELIDDNTYTSLQAIGRLENMLEEELGRDVDFASKLKPWEIDKLAAEVQEAERLDFEGKSEEAWAAAERTVALAKKMLLQREEGVGTFVPKDTFPAPQKPVTKPKPPSKAPPVEKPEPVVEPETEPEVSGSPGQQIYRGIGREDKESIYRYGDTPVVGEGAYYTTSEGGAREYGPNVETIKAGDVAKNPLVIKSDSDWLDLMRESGWRLPDPNERDTKVQAQQALEAANKVKNHLVGLGHDGLVVTFPSQGPVAQYNPNSPTTRSWGIIKDIFERPTVVSYGEAVQEKAKPTPVEKIKKKAKAKAKPKLADEGYDILPLPGIKTDPERFQVRTTGGESAVDEGFVTEAVDDFQPDAVDPIDVWRDPKDGNFYVLDGHHTREILSRVGRKEAAVRIFKGTEAQAIKKSQLKNTQRQEIDLVAQVQTIRALREGGSTKKAIKDEAKKRYKRNSATVVALSHLNPKGQIMSTLASMAKASDVGLNDFQKMAKWIGSARESNPELTNAHEQEMYDYLKDGKAGTEAEFVKRVNNRTRTLLGFDYTQPLNLKQSVSRTPVQEEYDRQLREANKAVSDAVAAKAKQVAKLEKQKVPEKIQEGILKKYDDAVTIAQREVLALKDRQQGVNANQQGEKTLFSILGPTTAERNNFKAEKRSLLRDGLITDAGIVASPASPHARNIEGLLSRWGRKVVWFKADQEPGKKQIGGWYDQETGVVFLNRSLQGHPVLTVSMHETAHHMQKQHPDLWSDVYQSIIENLAPGAYKLFEARRLELGYEKNKIPGELVAEIMAEVSTKDSFWRDLKARNPRAFSALVNKLLDVLRSVRNLLLRSKSYGGLEAYAKDFGAIERSAAKAFATMSEREFGTEPAPGPAGQGSLFSIIPGDASPLMEKYLKRSQEVVTGIRNARKKHGWGITRYIYQKMVDENTWVWHYQKKALASMGIDIYQEESINLPSKWLQKMAAWTEKADFALKRGVYSWDRKSVNYELGLQQIISKYKLAHHINTGEFGVFGMAMRMKAQYDTLGDSYFGGETKETQDVLFKEGASEQEKAARKEYAEMEELFEDYNERHPGELGWAAAAKEFSDFSDAVLKRLWQSGFISEEQYNAVTTKYSMYLPLYVLERETPSIGKFAYEMNKLIPGLARLDPIEGIIKNVYRIEFLAHQNAARLAAADFVNRHSGERSSLKGFGRRVVPSKSPLQDYVEQLKSAASIDEDGNIDTETEAAIDAMAKMYQTTQYGKEGYVSIMRDGEMEYWQFEPEILDVYTSFGGQSGSPALSQLMKFFTAQTKLLRAGAVLTPEFMQHNAFRDFQGAAVIATHLVSNPLDAALLPIRVLRGLAYAIEGHTDLDLLPESVKKPTRKVLGATRKALGMRGEPGEAWRDFVLSGSGFANMVSLDMRGIRNDLEAILRSSSVKFRAKQLVENPVKYILHTHPLTLLQNLSRLFENQTRIAVREKTVSDLTAKGMSLESAEFEADIQAREASTDFSRGGEYAKVINKIKPFFNPTIQGNDKLVRALFVDKGNRGKTWLRGVMLLTVPTVLLWRINHDEDWYKEEALWKKNLFWLFSPDNGKTVFMLPKPFEVGMIFASLPERFLDWYFDKDPKAVTAWVDDLAKDIIPRNIGDALGPAGNALNEAESNYDNFRETRIVKGRLEKVVPYEQYTSNTSEFAKWVGSWGPGRGLSPLKIDHIIRGSTGGLGRWGAEIASNIIMEADPSRREMKPASNLIYDKIPEWAPVLRGMIKVGPPRYTRQADDFFEEYDKAMEAVDTLRSYSTGATKEQYLEVYKRVGIYVDRAESLARQADALFKMSSQIRTVEAAPPEVLNRVEKQQELHMLLKARNELMFKYMKRYNALDGDEERKKLNKHLDEVERAWDESGGK